ncbi:MAG: HD domain-containing protein [Ardenticatenaceae bacterium]|nr:HD domain-containing protein [Ardenticatenaceae bacterium]
MKTKFISSLNVGDELINEPFLLQDVVPRTTKDGRPYLLYTLRDRSGQVGGVFWDVPDYVRSWVKPGVVALVSGKVNSYKETTQIMATDLNHVANPDMGDFLPSSQRPREEMVTELYDLIQALAEPWQKLVSHLLLQEDFLPQFVSAPAARGMHHAFIGGLLEHSLSMTKLARMLSAHYPFVNRDLLMAGALLHDMGKTAEYTVEGSFALSSDGKLVGHIVRAIVMIERAAAEIDFPEDLLRQLVHLVAAHHGTREWGSPVVPKTLEAVLLHQIDLLDSRVQGFFDHVREDAGEGEWTIQDSKMFGTALIRPSNFS